MPFSNHFSVLMSVYFKENPKFLDEAIKSILNQTLLPSEIVIVKDGTLTDDLNEILDKYSTNQLFKIIGYDKNKGLGPALELGLKNCSYDIVARMDSDDICYYKRFEIQINYINNNDIDFLGSNTIEFENEIENIIDVRLMPKTYEEIVKYSKKRNPFIHPSVVFKKSQVELVGGYRNMPFFEDYDIWLRLLKKGYKCVNIQKNLVYMRISKDFYRRRGGKQYFKFMLHFYKIMIRERNITYFEYIKTVIPRMVIALAPEKIREKFYETKLRNKVKKNEENSNNNIK